MDEKKQFEGLTKFIIEIDVRDGDYNAINKVLDTGVLQEAINGWEGDMRVENCVLRFAPESPEPVRTPRRYRVEAMRLMTQEVVATSEDDAIRIAIEAGSSAWEEDTSPVDENWIEHVEDLGDDGLEESDAEHD